MSDEQQTTILPMAQQLLYGICDESALIKLALKHVDASDIATSRALVKAIDRYNDDLFELAQKLVELVTTQKEGASDGP